MELENKVSEQINDIKKENFEKLAQLFPSIIKDGQVDFKALKEELGEFEEVKEEKYEFTWAGKQNAKKKVQEDVGARTLKYIEEDSKNPDTTENLYIEGDNLEVLKLLRQNYYGSIKMIYIDPPYNTDGDFVYKDNFNQNKIESDIQERSRDNEGNRLEINNKSSNRYHANWLNMMYPRLKVARDLLTDDGVIFISIDDNEQENLKKICNEIFKEDNFITTLVWEKKKKGSFLSKDITTIKEYIHIFSKNKKLFLGLIGEINFNTETYPCINANNKREIRIIKAGIESKFSKKDFFMEKGNIISDTTMNIVLHSDLEIKNGILVKDLVLEGNWRYSQEKMDMYADNKELYITRDLYIRRIVHEPRYKTLKDLLLFNEKQSEKINLNHLLEDSWGTNEDADEEQRTLFGVQKIMSYPKPVRLLFKLILSYREKELTILDFFSGSATTAHAVMQLNAEDRGNRKYIMVQLPEEVDEKSEAYKFLKENNKPTNICEIGKERIRRAGELIKKEIEESNRQLQLGEEPKKVPDIGFKVFRTADTNINWKKIREVSKDNVMKFDDPDMLDFTLGFNDKDVVYEVLLRQRDLPLSEKLVTLTDIGSRTYLYADSYLVCLETNVTEELIEKLAELNPLPIKFIFRDSAFGSKIGLKEETFRKLKTLVEKNSGLTKKAYTVEFI